MGGLADRALRASLFRLRFVTHARLIGGLRSAGTRAAWRTTRVLADYLATFIRDKCMRGVVFGSFNEGSPNMHQLLREVAREQAAARWRQAGYADYLSFLTTALYRRWGAAFARVNARVRITRLRLVGAPTRSVGDGEWDGLGGAGVFAEGNRPL